MQTGESFTAPARMPGGQTSVQRSRPRAKGFSAHRNPGFLVSRGTGEGLSRALVAIVCSGERLSDGRYRLQTSGSFDQKGPRSIAVGAAAVTQLARYVGALGIAAAAMLIAFFVFGFAAIVPLGIVIGIITQHGKGMTTRLLDRLGETVEP